MEPRQTLQTQKRYDKSARFYDVTVAPMELMMFGRHRPRFWSRVSGKRILEVGTGTGKNQEFYPKDARVVAIDLSPRMARKALRRADAAGRSADILLADAQQLPFRDGVFDASTCTCVFCSVPDPIQGLREMRRVTAPGGELHLLEHVRGPGPLGVVMDLVNPIAVRMGGANINRETLGNVQRAGIELEDVESHMVGIVKLMRGKPGKRGR